MTDGPKVCLLVDGPILAGWQAAALSKLFEETDALLTMVVYNQYDPERSVFDLFRRAIELREWSVAEVMFRITTPTPSELDPVALEEALDLDGVKEQHVHPEIVDGWKQKIPKSTVDSIADSSDLAVRFGFGFLVGPVLEKLEYGVLSYHHGDIREYRGQPMGFWEFIHGEREAGITVQILCEELDAGNVAALKRVCIDDLYTWQSVRSHLFEESHDMLRLALENIESDDVMSPESLGKVYTHPKGKPVIKYVFKSGVGIFREWIRS
jgi:folate-dependent phosphoribosylglycinamide formyltransferase PurN